MGAARRKRGYRSLECERTVVIHDRCGAIPRENKARKKDSKGRSWIYIRKLALTKRRKFSAIRVRERNKSIGGVIGGFLFGSTSFCRGH